MKLSSETIDDLFKTAKERVLFCELSELKRKNAMLEIEIEDLNKIIEVQIQFMALLDKQIQDFLDGQTIKAAS